MSDSVIRVALIGYGYAGLTFHAPLILACKALELSVIVSRQGEKILADKKNGQPRCGFWRMSRLCGKTTA